MLIPTKFTTLEESTIFKVRAILKQKINGETVSEAMSRTSGEFQDASEFLHALDILYVLRIIDIDISTGIISYAK